MHVSTQFRLPRSKIVDVGGSRAQLVESLRVLLPFGLRMRVSRSRSWLDLSSKVTVVTDLVPIPGMLTSRPGAVLYGHAVERARIILRPHLHNLRFM
ncbi:hypothetical protein CF327_g5762 [Tilletia walkeri]|nr:hypothetical protein CF327_g5762 [Tilletia walkeri]